MQRRSFAAAALGAAAIPALMAAAPASAQAPDQSEHNLDQLQRAMTPVLSRELDDPTTARTLVPWIADIGFDWHPPTAPVRELDFIVAYSFGNRPPAGGGDPTKVLYEPGPVNESLADTVAQVRARRDVPVYAQWEIASFLTSKYRMSNVTAIEPQIASDGTITYLSTAGVAAQVLAERKQVPGGVGTAGVVGFRDHVKRCVETTRLLGMPAAYAPLGFDMPGTYDPQSGQAWTRRRDLYLPYDMLAQWEMRYEELLTQYYPNG